MRPMNLVSVAATVLALSSPCYAQSPADFYRGKTVEIYIGTSVGQEAITGWTLGRPDA